MASPHTRPTILAASLLAVFSLGSCGLFGGDEDTDEGAAEPLAGWCGGRVRPDLTHRDLPEGQSDVPMW